MRLAPTLVVAWGCTLQDRLLPEDVTICRWAVSMWKEACVSAAVDEDPKPIIQTLYCNKSSSHRTCGKKRVMINSGREVLKATRKRGTVMAVLACLKLHLFSRQGNRRVVADRRESARGRRAAAIMTRHGLDAAGGPGKRSAEGTGARIEALGERDWKVEELMIAIATSCGRVDAWQASLAALTRWESSVSEADGWEA